jgi:hypothetical protein
VSLVFQQIEDYKIAAIPTGAALAFLDHSGFEQEKSILRGAIPTQLEESFGDITLWMKQIPEVPVDNQDWFIAIKGDEKFIFGIDNRDGHFITYWNLDRNPKSTRDTQFLDEIFSLKALHGLLKFNSPIKPLNNILLVGCYDDVFPRDSSDSHFLKDYGRSQEDSSRVCHGLDQLIRWGIPISTTLNFNPIRLDNGKDFLRETEQRDIIFFSNVNIHNSVDAERFEEKTKELKPQVIVVYGYSICRGNPYQIHGFHVYSNEEFSVLNGERDFSDNFFQFGVRKDFVRAVSGISNEELLRQADVFLKPLRVVSSVGEIPNFEDILRIARR